jgi:hypothetical protein
MTINETLRSDSQSLCDTRPFKLNDITSISLIVRLCLYT